MSKQKLLLRQDVYGLGRKGEVAEASVGYARNFLIPQQKAYVADANTLRIQARLQAEREKQAIADRKVSEELAAKVKGTVCSTHVKVDPAGHMYGSVTVLDVVRILSELGLEVNKNSVALKHPIKRTGVHEIELKFPEDVSCSITLKVIPEGGELEEAAVAAGEVPEGAEAGEAPESEGGIVTR